MIWLVYILEAAGIFFVESVILANLGVDYGTGFAIVSMSTVFALVVCAAAENRGRIGSIWMFYGALLPIVALIHVLVISKDQAELERRQIAAGGQRKCPFCAELIKSEAVRCKHCGSDISTHELKPLGTACPRCTKPNPPELPMCYYCGADMKQTP
jgi:RNA polymerase subunit RPABC4/transcription elongation factor Spt4